MERKNSDVGHSFHGHDVTGIGTRRMATKECTRNVAYTSCYVRVCPVRQFYSAICIVCTDRSRMGCLGTWLFCLSRTSPFTPRWLLLDVWHRMATLDFTNVYLTNCFSYHMVVMENGITTLAKGRFSAHRWIWSHFY